MPTTETPRQFQHYEVLRRADGSPWELGRGAMGITYKAYDVNLCCEVALKVVNSALLDHPDARERFVREARAAAALRHRHVASVYHLGNDGQHFFYAMEFIDGETLDALVKRRGPLPVGAVLKIILQVTKALVAADRQRLVHRDLKPANLMIVHEDADEETTVKVIDFGLARQTAGTDGAAQVTLAGFVGTPQYASPEQLEEQPLDARSDIYSLGVTAWFLLLGRPPFSGSLASVCQQQLSNQPPWEQLPPGLDEGVRRLLGLMLEKDPANRPQSARELRMEIENCLAALPPDARSAPLLAPAEARRNFPSSPAPEPAPASLSDGRYTITRLLGEEPGVKIYRARDEERAQRAVTLRTLPVEWVHDRASEENLAEEIRLIQAAAHPHLVEIFAWEPSRGSAPAFLVEEPLAGLSLHELLTVRQTHLSASDALRFLEPAAEAADHADQRRLEHLDFSLRHVRIHFPYAGADTPDGELRGLLSLPLTEWPEWSLKIHPFATDRPSLEPGTWTGDVTLAQAIHPRVLAAESATRAAPPYSLVLARLAYELLGGTLPATRSQPVTYSSLPSLDEAGNAVLRRALSAQGGYATCHDFYSALAQVAAGRHESVKTAPNLAAKASHDTGMGAFLPAPSTARATTTDVGSPAWKAPLEDEPHTTPLPFRASVFAATEPPVDSIADLIAGDEPAPVYKEPEAGEGSLWERLRLSEPSSPRPWRWLFAIAAVVLVFSGAFAGVLAVLLHGNPISHSRAADRMAPTVSPSPASLGKRSPAPVASARSAMVSRTPIPASASIRSTATVADVEPDSSPVAAGLTPPQVAPVPSTALPSPPQAEMTVHLDSEPSGAAVWRGEQRVGETPADIKLPPGNYDLVYQKSGWQATHQYLHVDETPHQTPELMHLVPANWDPLHQPPPERRPGTEGPVPRPAERRPFPHANALPVRPALPVTPAARSEQAPVLRAVPIQPFRQPSADAPRGTDALPTTPKGDEDQD